MPDALTPPDMPTPPDMSTPPNSLRARLVMLEENGGSAPVPCRLERLLTEGLDPETSAVLRRLVEETDVPVQSIRQQLQVGGERIGWATLKQHRNKICTCYVEHGVRPRRAR